MLHLCSRCGKVVILNVFETRINTVSFLPVFLSCILGVFNSPCGVSGTQVSGA